MPNSIKYTTGSETLALKKGNFYIGTGDVGKGPTSSTGYYNGITPPSGGYTIYLNKESNGPSIYTASNDAQLISLTNSIASASYTTVNECLNYYYTQSDKMCVNSDYPNIPTDGLILNFDAGFVGSYPKSGTSWKDLSLTQTNSTLTNGPTFSTSGGGSLNFDGVNDYSIQTSNPYGSGTQQVGGPLTISSWFYMPNGSNIGVNTQYGTDVFEIVSGDNSGSGGPIIWLCKYNGDHTSRGSTIYYRPDRFVVGAQYSANQIVSNTSVSSKWDQWVNITFTMNPGTNYLNNTITLYINGTFECQFNRCPSQAQDWKIGQFKLGTGVDGYFVGNISTVQMWNRVFNSDEVSQLYNSTKSRYGH